LEIAGSAQPRQWGPNACLRGQQGVRRACAGARHVFLLACDAGSGSDTLRRAGIAAAARAGVRRRAPPTPKERKKRAYRPRHVTNVHMPELFREAAPAQID